MNLLPTHTPSLSVNMETFAHEIPFCRFGLKIGRRMGATVVPVGADADSLHDIEGTDKTSDGQPNAQAPYLALFQALEKGSLRQIFMPGVL